MAAMGVNIALLVIGDGRSDLLERTCQSIAQYAGWVDHALMVDDTGDPDYASYLRCNYPDYTITHGGRRGMAGAVQAGFDAVLDTKATHALWIEEDMELTRPLPIRPAIAILNENPTIAQMCFRREPWWGSPPEMEQGDQLAAITTLATQVDIHDGWTSHDYLFSLNPCVIPRKVLELGWDVDNEAGFTRKLIERGYRFGSWGLPDFHCAWARHIGETRSVGWRL